MQQYAQVDGRTEGAGVTLVSIDATIQLNKIAQFTISVSIY